MAQRRTADRYTRFVSTLKIGLPLVAIALLASVFMLSGRSELPGGLSFSASDMRALGTGLKVTRPRFSGASIDGDIYDFMAEEVAPRSTKLESAEITDLAGTVRFRDGQSVAIAAEKGEVNLVGETLQLSRSVRIDSSEGYRASADDLYLDLRAGSITGVGNIRATGPLGEITSSSLQITSEEGLALGKLSQSARLFFSNGVKVRYEPSVTSKRDE